MDCEQTVKTFLKDCRVNESYISGFLDLDDLDTFLDCLKAHGFSYYKRNTVKYEASSKYKSSKIRFSYGTKIPFFGYPFIINKSIYMRCSQDRDCKLSLKENASKSLSPKNDEIALQKKRTISQPSKKVGCKATLHITYLLIFRNITVQNRQTAKKEASEKIKSNLAEFVKHCETKLLIELSTVKEHNHPPSAENQIIHPSLKSEIYRLVANDVTLTTTIKSHLTETVQKMIAENKIPQPDINNHCFYPPNDVIRYHVYMAKFSIRKEHFDESTVLQLIELWKNKCDDKFHFKPSSSQKIKPTVIFCHQTKWQEYLLNYYGNSITILDAAYKTTGYNFPLYFLIVKTNKSFIPVGTLVLNSPVEVAITEALNIFRQWNPNWYPRYWTCGHLDPERNAIQKLFPKSIINLCTHRVQHTWRNWLQENVSDVSEHMITFWRALMFSKTEEEFSEKELLMKKDKLYKQYSTVGKYFYNVWYPLREKWVIAYQIHEFYVFIHMNNGIETGAEFFTYKFLTQHEDRALTNILTVIIEHYLPECLNDYRDYNTIARIFDDMTDRPVHIVNHITKRYQIAECQFQGATIVCTTNNKFMLKSSTEEEWYYVDFEDVNCTCYDFQVWRYPCIHMGAIFTFTQSKLSNLAQWYLNSVYFKLDQQLSQFLNDLPSWYFNKNSQMEISSEKTTDDVHFLCSDLFMEFTDTENISNMTEWQPCSDIIQIKKNQVYELINTLSAIVEQMSGDDLDKCYTGLKSLHDEFKGSTQT